MLYILNPTGDLYYASQERRVAEKINEIIEVEMLERDDASLLKTCQKLASGDYLLIHYAGHLRLSGERIALRLSDGELELSELRRIFTNNSKKPSMVFLNACSSAWTLLSRGGKISLNLAREILLSGVPLCVGTCNDVFDNSAAVIAEEFYTKVLSGLRVGLALTEARRKVRIISSENDISWLYYVLYGNPMIRVIQ